MALGTQIKAYLPQDGEPTYVLQQYAQFFVGTVQDRWQQVGDHFLSVEHASQTADRLGLENWRIIKVELVGAGARRKETEEATQ